MNEGAQICMHPPLACEHIQAHVECASERRDNSFCDNAAGSCFDMSGLPAAAFILDGTDSEPDV